MQKERNLRKNDRLKIKESLKLTTLGFTLVELIAVIAILAVILVMFVPNLLNGINSKKNDALNKVYDIIETATRNYVIDYNISTPTRIELEDLCKTTYIECPIINPNTEEELDGYIFVNNDYIYSEITETPLTVDLNDGETSQTFNDTYEPGTVIELTTPTKVENEFKGWKVVKGNSGIRDNKLVIGTTETILWAEWNRYSIIEFELDGGTVLSDQSGKYMSGTVMELEIPTRENYKFTGWIIESGNGNISGNIFTVGSEDTKIKAIWEKVYPYTVVYKTPDGIILETNTITRTYGTIETITPLEISGYITPSSKEVKWEGEELKTIEFIYIPKGELIVIKNVEGTTTDEEFKFTITITGDNISGNQTFSDVTFVNGVGEFTLKHGQSKSFELPANISYKIEEEVNENYSMNFELNEESDSNISFSENTKDINKSNYIKFLNNGFKNYSTTYEKTTEKVVNQYELTPLALWNKIVTIYKVDQYGEPVMGAELKIVDVKYGEFSAQWNTSDYPDGYTTQISGAISLDSLVLEEISAPDGYRLSEPISLSQSISSYVMREELVLYMVDEKTFIDGVITHNDVQTITVTNTYNG